MHTEYTINYQLVITEPDVASCTQADEDVLSCKAFYIGMKLNDEFAQVSLVIIQILFLSLFHDLGIDNYMVTLENETEERIMSSLGVISPVVQDDLFWLIFLFCTGNPTDGVVLYELEFLQQSGKPYTELDFFTQKYRARHSLVHFIIT